MCRSINLFFTCYELYQMLSFCKNSRKWLSNRALSKFVALNFPNNGVVKFGKLLPTLKLSEDAAKYSISKFFQPTINYRAFTLLMNMSN